MWALIFLLAAVTDRGYGRRVQLLSHLVPHSHIQNDMDAESAAIAMVSNGSEILAPILLAYPSTITMPRSSVPSPSSSSHEQAAGLVNHQSIDLSSLKYRSGIDGSTQYRRSRALAMMLFASPPATSLAIFGVANAIGFLISAATGWHYHLDLIGTGVFSISAFILRGDTLAQACSAGAIGLWATKLASFLFYRVLQTRYDARLSNTLSTTTGQFGFWFISFLWGWFVSLPHTLAAGVPVSERPEFGVIHMLGLIMFAVGFYIETAADYQKWMFKANSANAGKFCDVGVWKLCQHPNWFGNLLLWSGIFVLNSPTLLADGSALALGGLALPTWIGAVTRLLSAAMSPLFLFWLFSGQANGRPPLQQGFELMQERFGSDAAFIAYEASTPRLIPTLQSIKESVSGK